MIRFSASLVVVALGLLVAGGVTSKLMLVYVAIAVSAIALVFLIIGAVLNRGELRASSPAEAPGDPLDEASTGRLDRAPADDGEKAGPGRPDSVAAGVSGDDLTARPDRLVAGARGDDPAARPDAVAGITNSASDTSSAVDTSRPGDTENAKDTGGTGGVEDLADTQSADQPVTVVPGVPRYHRSGCILIRFMGDSDLQKMPTWAARKAGCNPCRACHTDGEETG